MNSGYLFELFASTQGLNWNHNFAWLSERRVCQWYGITCQCSSSLCNLNIDLSSNNLVGTLPDLRNNNFNHNNTLYVVNSLILSDNKIAGTMPNFFPNIIPDNFELDVSFNQLSGTIPHNGILSRNIARLDLRHNSFTGFFHTNMEQWSKNVYIRSFQKQSEDQNKFECPIPNSLLKYSDQFEDFTCQLNPVNENVWQTIFDSLNGNYWYKNDGWFTNSNKCTWFGIICSRAGFPYGLNISNNNLTGVLPFELGSLDLSHIDLSHNTISGTIPFSLSTSFVENFHNAEYEDKLDDTLSLYLNDNHISGTIPSELGTIRSIYHAHNSFHMNVKNNNLNGDIPIDLKNIATDVQLSLTSLNDNNRFFCDTNFILNSHTGVSVIHNSPNCDPYPPSPLPPSPNPPPPANDRKIIFDVLNYVGNKCCRKIKCELKQTEITARKDYNDQNPQYNYLINLNIYEEKIITYTLIEQIRLYFKSIYYREYDNPNDPQLTFETCYYL